MRAAALLAALAVVAACTGTTADEGRDAMMQVAGAQFFRGGMPADASGPKVASVVLLTQAARAGQTGKPLGGALEPPSASAAITLAGDRGYWVVAAGVPDVQSPTFPSFKASLGFARDLSPGPHDLVIRAVDASGHFGPATTSTLNVTDESTPTGKLVFSLSWDTESDLDLHLVDPNGVEIYKGNINSWSPPGPGQPPADPNAYKTGGILDFDSNAECVIDGRRRENIVYSDTAPPGHYVVRVDTFSLCGELSAHWTVEARADGAIVARATGSSFETDTQMLHDRGAGVLALELDR